MKKTTKRYRVGIDGSTTKTGVAVFEIKETKKGTVKTLIHYELVDAEKNAAIPEEYKTKKKDTKKAKKSKSNQRTKLRVVYTIRELYRILSKFSGHKDIVMEDTYGATDISSQKELARIQGAVQGLALSCNDNFSLIYPSSWRSAVGMELKNGEKWKKREEFKRDAVDLVKRRYKITVPDDIADAILIGDAD